MTNEYRFAAERQLIFYVFVEGLSRLIQFGERSLAGASNFFTPDEKIANAIRKTSLFRRGVIKETTVKTEPKPVIPANISEPRIAMGVSKPAAAASVAQPVPKVEAPASGKENVLEVKNFTQAKEAVCKKLGISKRTVKTPQMLAVVAQEAGITIKYLE